MTGEHQTALTQIPHHRHPAGGKIVEHPREQLLQSESSPGQQGMAMPALRHTATVLASSWKQVALHHRDTPVGIRQHLSGHQPAHAGAENHAMFPEHAHIEPPAI
jgi:hypothetical protein